MAGCVFHHFVSFLARIARGLPRAGRRAAAGPAWDRRAGAERKRAANHRQNAISEVPSATATHPNAMPMRRIRSARFKFGSYPPDPRDRAASAGLLPSCVSFWSILEGDDAGLREPEV